MQNVFSLEKKADSRVKSDFKELHNLQWKPWRILGLPGLRCFFNLADLFACGNIFFRAWWPILFLMKYGSGWPWELCWPQSCSAWLINGRIKEAGCCWVSLRCNSNTAQLKFLGYQGYWWMSWSCQKLPWTCGFSFQRYHCWHCETGILWVWHILHSKLIESYTRRFAMVQARLTGGWPWKWWPSSFKITSNLLWTCTNRDWNLSVLILLLVWPHCRSISTFCKTERKISTLGF